MTQPLDVFDLKILAELQADGGRSNQEIAERVGLSPSPCSRRIRHLEDLGVIQERAVRLDLVDAIGRGSERVERRLQLGAVRSVGTFE